VAWATVRRLPIAIELALDDASMVEKERGASCRARCEEPGVKLPSSRVARLFSVVSPKLDIFVGRLRQR
jgi:hypothetical protein